MGLINNSPIVYREFSWGKIVFSSKRHIVVETPIYKIVFHNFGAPRGDYSKSWGLFRRELRRKNFESLNDVFKYANHFEVLHYTKNINWKDSNGRKIN